MIPPSSSPSPSPSANIFAEAIQKNRAWFIIGGLIYLLTGLAAIIYPQVASVAIVKVISILLIITGVVSLFVAMFSKHETHRTMHGILALLRIILGSLIFKEVFISLAIITLILAVLFLIEGIFGIITTAQLKGHKFWPLLLLNSLIALGLGILILAQYPKTAEWIVGLLYGVNAVFAGTALLLLGCGGGRHHDPANWSHGPIPPQGPMPPLPPQGPNI